ncbi:MAG: hypothetical protein KBT19_00410 [Lachnospiraceae bacterium]|nr:hypothetical protein [Candidatus Colinaster equi]
MIVSIFLLILILVIMPFCVGLVPAYFIDRRKRRISLVYVFGMIVSLAIFQLIAVPVIINKGDGFRLIITLFLIITGVLSVVGIALVAIEVRKYGTPINRTDEISVPKTKEEKIYWIIFIALVVIQILLSCFMQYFDGDDAYYVVESLLTNETDTLYRIKPYTGLSTGMDLRHAMASMPVWIAYIARISGIHSTIVSHIVVPIVMLPLLYMIYYQCGRILFRKERKKLPIFMIFVWIMYMFGNVSIYTNATFMMTRTWQGKAMLANLVLLTVIWILLALFETERLVKEWRLGYYIILFFTNILAAMCSTASVFLVAMLLGLSGIVLGIAKKNIQIPLKLMITCTPLAIYGAMFILI